MKKLQRLYFFASILSLNVPAQSLMAESSTGRNNTSFLNMTGAAGGLNKTSNLTVPSTESAIPSNYKSPATLSSTLSGSSKNDPMAWWITHMSEYERTRGKDSVSTPQSSFPAFIRPSVNPTDDCNIWGPLCQTGFIEVGLNLTTKITTTTVPCSYYLSAQAESAIPPGRFLAPKDYQASFGHSPECSAYAQVFRAGDPDEEQVRSSVSAFSNCGSDAFAHSQRPREYTPPGVSNYNVGGGARDYFCCGDCSLAVTEIRLLYFPGATSVQCSQSFANTTSTNVLSSSKILSKRVASLMTNGSIFVSDGYTFTSPSFYVQMIGAASVQDSCGLVGSVYTNAIVPVPADGLSTISLDLPVGATFMNREYWRWDKNIASYTKKVRIEDLACPTWGLVGSEKPYPDPYLTVGPPFLPIIHPPSELVSFHPAWAQCSAFRQYGVGGYMLYEVFDPPRQLVPASAIAPATNPADIITASEPTPTIRTSKPNPADVRLPELPSITSKPALPNAGQESTGKKSQLPALGLGQIIYSAFGGSWVPEAKVPHMSTSTIALSGLKGSPLVFVVGGSKLTADPSAMTFGGKIISQNDPAVNVAGTSVQLKSNGIVIGVNTIALPTPAPALITVGDQVVTVSDPSTISVAGGTLLVGGNPVKVSGAILSLASNGHLVVEIDETSAKKGAANADPGSFVSTDSKELVIGGMVLRPGGSVVNVAGTPVSMAEGGEIFVGTIDQSKPSTILTNIAEGRIVSSGVFEGLFVGDRITIAGHVLTRMPSALKVGDLTLHPGGAGATISGTPIGFAKSDSLVIGRNTLKLPDPHLSSFTISGHVFYAYSPSLLVDGTTMTPGGSAIVLSGTPIRLDSIGDVVIGGRTIKISNVPTSTPKFTVDGHVFAGNPSVLSVDGKTLVAGAAAITLAGTPVSLDTSGTLRLGTSEIPLITTSSLPGSSLGGDGSPQVFFGHTGKRMQVPGQLGLVAVIGLTLWLCEAI